MLMGNWYGMLAPAGIAGRRAGIAGEGDARSDEEPDGRRSVSPPAAWTAGPTARAFRERIEREAAYWGPELKKLGIQAE